ncbi:hypothetical protein ACOLZ1_001861 [Vibrio fluvialis]
MISERTDIPRLQACRHLSNVRTELYLRQVLGRILRITDGNNQETWLYTFAKASLVKFSEEIEQDIPESCLYVKSPGLNEQQSPSSISTGEMPSLVTPKIRGSLVWSDGSGELAAEETYTSFNSFTLGHFKERVIEAFLAI